MRKIALIGLLTLFVFLVSCVSSTPPEPSAPGETKGGAVAGQAYYIADVAQIDTRQIDYAAIPYAQPRVVTIDKTVLSSQGEVAKVKMANPDSIKWGTGYLWDGTKWIAKTAILEAGAAKVSTTNWIQGGNARFDIDYDSMIDGENYFVTYDCVKEGSVWNCNGGEWMLHTVAKGIALPEAPTAPKDAAATDAERTAAITVTPTDTDKDATAGTPTATDATETTTTTRT